MEKFLTTPKPVKTKEMKSRNMRKLFLALIPIVSAPLKRLITLIQILLYHKNRYIKKKLPG